MAGGGLITLLTSVVLLGQGLISSDRCGGTPPPDFQTSLVIGDGLEGPSGFEIAPDGRIFILERAGKIKIVKNGQLLPTPFADLPSEDTGDRGLIGIAFDPDFGVSNHFVYFYYTGHDLLNHLVRFERGRGRRHRRLPSSCSGPRPHRSSYTSGEASASDRTASCTSRSATTVRATTPRTLSNPHGKILRINKDGSIPEDNPFVGPARQAGGHLGLRLPQPVAVPVRQRDRRAVRR